MKKYQTLVLLFDRMGKTMKLLGKKRRQIIASVLIVAMILAMLPVPVMATETGYSYNAAKNELTITSDAGTTAWRSDPEILINKVQSIIVTDAVTSIEEDAFHNCTGLTSIVIGKNVTSFGTWALINTPMLSTLTVAADNKAYKTVDNVLFTADGKTLVKYPESKTGPSYTVPADVKVIGVMSFAYNAYVTSITLPNTVTEIKEYAFASAKIITIDLGNSLEVIGNIAFNKCIDLKYFVLPSTLTSIGEAAFADCNFVSVTIPAGVTDIGAYAFGGSSSLKSVFMQGTDAPTLGTQPFSNSPNCMIYTPAKSTGYDASNWPSDQMVKGWVGLSSLTLKGITLSPHFSPDVTSYTASVENSVRSIAVTPTIEIGDSVTVNGNAVTSGKASDLIDLNEGENTITVVVANSNNPAETNTYTVKVTRESAPVVNYNLWVGNTQVTSANKNDITATGVTGKVSYNSDTNTLTLDGVNIPDTVNYISTDSKYGIYAKESLNIELKGTNTITGGSAEGIGSAAIYVSDKLTISGNGSLFATGGSVVGITDYGSYGIAANQLTINSGDVTAKGGSCDCSYSYGIFCKNTMKLNDGTVTAIGNNRAIKTTALEFADYTNVKATASVNANGNKTVIYNAEDIADYRYLAFELGIDKTAPVIRGIQNGKSYCDAVTVTVTDVNLDTVTVNGTAATLTGGKFTLSKTGTEQTVVATDKAGNSVTVTVTVYDGHAWEEGVVTTAPTASKKGVKTYTCTHCGETKTEEIAMLAPSVTEGQNATWKPDEGGTLTFRSDAAFSDFIRVLVDGKEIDAQYYELKEGSIIVTLKADYLATLPVGIHTLGIQSSTGTASTEFTITAKTEDKTPSKSGDKDSPKTGDNSNMQLWITLLFISGGALTVFGIKSRKRKAVK